MQKITVEPGPLSVTSGHITLTAHQAKPRLHALEAVKVDKSGNGVYRVTAPLQFKRGETFSYDGEVNKAGVLSDPAAEREAQASAEAKLRASVRAEVEAQVRAELQPQLDKLAAYEKAEADAAKK